MTFQRLKIFFLSPRFWLVLAIAVFLAQAAVYPFVLRTHLDEGNYSILGYSAVTGMYPMYKDGGPWFPYMPLSFLVPGAVHALFGKQLCVVRIFSILCGGLTIFFAYKVARRLGGDYAALTTLWLLVSSGATIQYYSLGGPVPFCAFLVMASVFVLTGRMNSPLREIIAVLCAAAALGTRQNMVLSWLIVLLYSALTQKRTGHTILVMALGLLAPLAIILPFSPDIIDKVLVHHQSPSFLATILANDPLIETETRLSWPMRAYVGAVYYLFKYYYVIITATAISCAWAFIKMREETPLLKALHDNREIALIVTLFLGNLLLHVVAPLFSPAPFAMYAYFNYYAPLAAIIGGLGLAAIIAQIKQEYLQGITVGVLAVAMVFSVFPSQLTSNWRTSFTVIPSIDFAAKRLAALTSPQDKIFSITLSPEFLLADRRPYPQLVVFDGFTTFPDSEKVLKFNRYNYALADKWLKEADVVILSDQVCHDLGMLYKGSSGSSGRDVVDLAEKVASRDFALVEEISRTSRGAWRIYRRAGQKSGRLLAVKPTT